MFTESRFSERLLLSCIVSSKLILLDSFMHIALHGLYLYTKNVLHLTENMASKDPVYV